MKTHQTRRHRGNTRVASDATAVAAVVLESDLGWIAIAFQEDALRGIVFGHDSRRQAVGALERVLSGIVSIIDCIAVDDCSVAIRDVVERIVRYASGEQVDFRDVALDDSHLTPFARKVVAATRRIPAGQTRSYGQLATVCGSPGAARAVGSVMAKNRYPIVVPCHRVIGANGAIGGFSSPQGLTMKRRMLALEADANSLSKAPVDARR